MFGWTLSNTRITNDQEMFREGGLVACAFAIAGHLAVPGEMAATARPVAFMLGRLRRAVAVAAANQLQSALQGGDGEKKRAVETEVALYSGDTHGLATQADLDKKFRQFAGFGRFLA